MSELTMKQLEQDQMADKYDLPNGWTCYGCGDEYMSQKKLVYTGGGTFCDDCWNDPNNNLEELILNSEIKGE